MKKLLFAFLFVAQIAFSQSINIIPQPVSVRTSKGTFPLTKTTVVVAKDAEDIKTAELFNEYCRHKRCLECAVGNALLGEVSRS